MYELLRVQKIKGFFSEKGFSLIDERSYPVFKAYEGTDPQGLQERRAAIICAWSKAHQGLWKRIHGFLCGVYFFDQKDIYFTLHKPPEGGSESLTQVIDILYNLAVQAELPVLRIHLVEEGLLPEYQGVSGYDTAITTLEEENEYVYPVKELLNLEGGVNYYKRKRIKKFMNRTDISLVPLNSQNIRLCEEIENSWCDSNYQQCGYCRSFYGCEKEAVQGMTGIFDEQRHQGLLGYLGSKPVGFIICEKTREGAVFLYFGKGIIPDFFLYLIYIMFRDYLSDAAYMNFSDDLGEEGLRLFKRKLSSHEQRRRYRLTFSKKEAPQ